MIEYGDFTYFNINGTNTQGEPLVLRCNPDETSLYLHSPQFREVDHIYHLAEDVTDNQMIGAMVWRHLLGDEAFDEFSQAMIESGNWEYHYRPEPLEYDMECFASSQILIPESLPNDFN